MQDELFSVYRLLVAKRLLPHVEQIFTPFDERFLGLAKIESLFDYGETAPEIRAKLDGFGATYLTSFAGFSS